MSPPSFFVHEDAVCESPHVGDGTRIWARCHVFAGARIGARCNLGEGCFVENDVVVGDGCTIKNGVSLWDRVTLEDDVFVGPHAIFTNDVAPRSFLSRKGKHFLPTTIRHGASIGAGAVIVCGVTVGRFAFVGAGAVVIRDVPDHALVVGNPARVIGRVCFCGARLDEHDHCDACDLALGDNSQVEATRRVHARYGLG